MNDTDYLLYEDYLNGLYSGSVSPDEPYDEWLCHRDIF